LRGGALLQAGPGALLAEVRGEFVGLDFDTTGDSNAASLGVMLGYRLTVALP
jgi:hypothetical protein